MIVVLDTNVWISALQFAKQRGTPTRAVEKAMSEDVIASCPEIEAEILRVLTEKFLWVPNRAQAALQAVLARDPCSNSRDCEEMSRPQRRHVPGVCRARTPTC